MTNPTREEGPPKNTRGVPGFSHNPPLEPQNPRTRGVPGLFELRRYPVSGIRYPVSGIRYPVCGIRYFVSGIRYPITGIRCPVSGVRYPVSGIRYQVFGIRYQLSGVRYPVSGIRYPVSGIFESRILGIELRLPIIVILTCIALAAWFVRVTALAGACRFA
jgi:hypothetical protein